MHYVNWKYASISMDNSILVFTKVKITSKIVAACKKPITEMKVLQNLFLGFHLRIPVLKISNKFVYLSSSETRFWTISPKYLI